jgi:hypothetical protein
MDNLFHGLTHAGLARGNSFIPRSLTQVTAMVDGEDMTVLPPCFV